MSTPGRRHPLLRLLLVALVALVALLAALASSSPAHADPSTGAGPFGGEILGNPVPGPVLPAPNVFPLSPPVPVEPGFAPAPDLSGRQTFPVPGPGVVVQDGPGPGSVDVQPGRVDADKPPADAGQPDGAGSAGDIAPVGKLSRADEKYLKRRGVDPHTVKGENNLRSGEFDIYLDRHDNMFAVRKGVDPKLGVFLGNIDDW